MPSDFPTLYEINIVIYITKYNEFIAVCQVVGAYIHAYFWLVGPYPA